MSRLSERIKTKKHLEMEKVVAHVTLGSYREKIPSNRGYLSNWNTSSIAVLAGTEPWYGFFPQVKTHDEDNIMLTYSCRYLPRHYNIVTLLWWP